MQNFRKWHRWVGLIAALFLVSVSVTGILLQFQQLFGDEEAEQEKLAASTSPYLVETSLHILLPKLDAAQKDVAARVGGSTPLDSVEFQLRGDHPSFILHAGGRRFTVAAETGAVEKDEPDKRESLLLRLHTGEVLGDGGVVLGLFWGAALLILTLSGLFLYWQMFRARAKKYGWKRVFWLFLLFTLGAPSARGEDLDQNRLQAADKNGDAPHVLPAEQVLPSPLTATLVTTLNGSVLGKVNPSVAERANLDYTLTSKDAIDLRLEYYTDGSYNSDPPRQLTRNINEPKFEGQLTYTVSVSDHYSTSGAALYHENYRFQDAYWWGIVMAGYTVSPLDGITIAANISGEERFTGGRPFADFSGTLNYAVTPDWALEGNLHRYENYGQSDPSPTQKREYELSILRKFAHAQFVGVSYFRHVQFAGTNDQFSFVKLKYGVTF